MWHFKIHSSHLCLPSLPLLSLCSSHPPFLQGHGPTKAGGCSANKKGSKKVGSTGSKSSKKASLLFGGDVLSYELYRTMKNLKEVRLCIHVCGIDGARWEGSEQVITRVEMCGSSSGWL